MEMRKLALFITGVILWTVILVFTGGCSPGGLHSPDNGFTNDGTQPEQENDGSGSGGEGRLVLDELEREISELLDLLDRLDDIDESDLDF